MFLKGFENNILLPLPFPVGLRLQSGSEDQLWLAGHIAVNQKFIK